MLTNKHVPDIMSDTMKTTTQIHQGIDEENENEDYDLIGHDVKQGVVVFVILRSNCTQ